MFHIIVIKTQSLKLLIIVSMLNNSRDLFLREKKNCDIAMYHICVARRVSSLILDHCVVDVC